MRKFKIIISDLHLGAGHQAEGNALEDFGSDQELADLLDRIAAESQRDGSDVELIFNGDAFEMLQVPHTESFDPVYAYAPEQYHSSSEQDSVLKMAIVISGHPLLFDALRRFVQAGPPRRQVTFVKGNHDLNLYWPGVQEQIRGATNTIGERRPLLLFEERRISREGIYVEHGNQYGEAIDRVKDMEDPHDHDRPGQLALPLGSWFVMDVFNEVERQKFWIDGVKPITALVWYALAFDFVFAAQAIVTVIRRLPGIIHEGVFDVEEEPRTNALARLLADPARVKGLAARYEGEEGFHREFNAEVARALTPVVAAGASLEVAPLTPPSDPARMGEQIQSHVHSCLFEAARQRAAEEGAKLVTFGHTHDARTEELPGGAVYINSGTWTWRADFTGAGKETWRDVFEHPERFTDDCTLHYVRVDYDGDGQPHGRLLQYEPEEESVLPTKPSPEDLVGFLGWIRRWWARLVGQL